MLLFGCPVNDDWRLEIKRLLTRALLPVKIFSLPLASEKVAD
jgi:hypothetical protein